MAGRGPALAGLVVGLVLAIGPAGAGLSGLVPDTSTAPPPTAPPAASTTATSATSAATAAPAGPATPVRVRAGTVGLDAAVIPVGVRDDGQMAVPERVAEVGWYRFGPAPGAPAGSAVLAGHVDDRVQGEGAFADLGDLRPGDEVTVQGPGGPDDIVVHRVREVRTSSKEALPLADLFRETGPAQLALVTCDGPFDTEARSYRDNLVVLAGPG
ncbi:class F sortase [Actinomycetospora flava]|uniref:Class F sortase n=1 Tax=Actinomycetospora flava TaxID=3129232 RepID=A0ABU8M575_9PSEU